MASKVALLVLSSVVNSSPSLFVVLRGGILGRPPSPAGSFKYLLAVQISEAFISSRKFSQCFHFDWVMASPYLVLSCLRALCE